MDNLEVSFLCVKKMLLMVYKICFNFGLIIFIFEYVNRSYMFIMFVLNRLYIDIFYMFEIGVLICSGYVYLIL